MRFNDSIWNFITELLEIYVILHVILFNMFQKVKSLPAIRRPGFIPWVREFGEIPWRRKWLPTPVFLPGESHGQRSLVGYISWCHKELNITEWLTSSLFYYLRKLGNKNKEKRIKISKKNKTETEKDRKEEKSGREENESKVCVCVCVCVCISLCVF